MGILKDCKEIQRAVKQLFAQQQKRIHALAEAKCQGDPLLRNGVLFIEYQNKE